MLVWLTGNEVVQISAVLETLSSLPNDGRMRVSWKLIEADDPESVPRGADKPELVRRKYDEFDIYTTLTPNFSKVLHALDADVYTFYRAPVRGLCQLKVRMEESEINLFRAAGRWCDKGAATKTFEVSFAVEWPDGVVGRVAVGIKQIKVEPQPELNLYLETEPNETPEQTQPIPLKPTLDDYSIQITGSTDDIEYFDNGQNGSSGDDWFRVEYKGDWVTEERLLTACLQIPDQQVAVRIRCYVLAEQEGEGAAYKPGRLLPIKEYTEPGFPRWISAVSRTIVCLAADNKRFCALQLRSSRSIQRVKHARKCDGSSLTGQSNSNSMVRPSVVTAAYWRTASSMKRSR